MKYKLLGVEPVSYTSKKTGRPVEGTKLHLGYEKKTCMGLCVLTEYVSSRYSDLACDHLVGEDVEILYNRFGNVEDLKCVSASYDDEE